jgi:hypothetical protein
MLNHIPDLSLSDIESGDDLFEVVTVSQEDVNYFINAQTRLMLRSLQCLG